GDIDLQVTAGPVGVTLSGRFGFTRQTVTIGSNPTDVILVTMANVSTSLSVGSVSLNLNGIQGGILILPSGVAGSLTIASITLGGFGGASGLLGSLSFSVTNLILNFNTTNTNFNFSQ